MDTHPGTVLAHRFFAGTGASYDTVVKLFTLGCDVWWKKRIVDAIPKDASYIVDQACGTGILTFKIARRFPSCRVTGVELRDEYLNIAKEKARALRLKNVDFLLGKAEDVRVDGPVDCITSSYLAKYAELRSLIRNAKAMLRPGGLLVMHDFACPKDPWFARFWAFYLQILQTVGPKFFPEWKTVFDELPCFLRQTTWLTELPEVLQENGFSPVRTETLTCGASALVTATKSAD
ncbi:class I SAM-dependent methyltransferase [Methylocaldum szegediense]|uniref:Demethylmenaquinone methyltransferase/2-methoxy-6-polyprenyl-1,4-benzoquinol methylase n=1 Tax=Methylocaldum szegediense TaxID=73780 RepID=A0ABN8X271_9GAMM|nr:class I SAM-dependent methyltransferase [Methylocaldum szegediense]CAI8827769.1 Demethylmenaquinone methyltransferase/2-methoxy-6-polyprenyl-1,4-benzoquinol methylase [Methylocaldum szegediense]